MIRTLKTLTEAALPGGLQLALRYRYHQINGSLDAEMLFADERLSRRRRFLDIGASIGIYSYHFRNRMKFVDAFEPVREATYRLSCLNTKSIVIHNVALSDKDGFQTLFIPTKDGVPVYTRSSVEPRDGNVLERRVETRRLDGFGFSDVDLVKIDVEGHEHAVLSGGKETIRRSRPILIVEIEQRHTNRPMKSRFEEIEALGYNGLFIKGGSPIPVEDFSFEEHQRPYLTDDKNPNYINNFVFLPRS